MLINRFSDKKKPLFVVFSNFFSVNIHNVADFKLSV